jgi:hypothetical protein
VFRRRRRGSGRRNGPPPLPAKSRALQLSRIITTRLPARRTTRVSQAPRMRWVPAITGPPRGIMHLLWPMRAGRKGNRMPLPFTAARTAARSPRVAVGPGVLHGGLVVCVPELEHAAPENDAAARHAKATRMSIPQGTPRARALSQGRIISGRHRGRGKAVGAGSSTTKIDWTNARRGTERQGSCASRSFPAARFSC